MVYHYAEAFKNKDTQLLDKIKELEDNEYQPKEVSYILNIAEVLDTYFNESNLLKAISLYDKFAIQWDKQVCQWQGLAYFGPYNMRPSPNDLTQKWFYDDYGLDMQFLELVARGFLDAEFLVQKPERGFMITCNAFNLIYPKVYKTEREAIEADKKYLGLNNLTGPEKLPLNWRYVYLK